MFPLTTHHYLRRFFGVHSRVVCRFGPRGFLFLVMMELLLVFSVMNLAFNWIPWATPYSKVGDIDQVRNAVIARLGGMVDDPLIEVTPGVSARSSNLRGFRRQGVNYYYFVEGEQNYDPLSRGSVDAKDIEVLLRDADGPKTFVIYRLR